MANGERQTTAAPLRITAVVERPFRAQDFQSAPLTLGVTKGVLEQPFGLPDVKLHNTLNECSAAAPLSSVEGYYLRLPALFLVKSSTFARLSSLVFRL